MAIETIQDLNAQACCCDLLLCPVPVLVCESLTAHFQSQGHINPASLTWELFKKFGATGVWERTDTVLVEDVDESVDGEPSLVKTIDLDTFYGSAYTRLHHGGIGSGSGCPSWPPETPGDSCEASGTSNRKEYLTSTHTIGEFPDLENVYTNELASETAATISNVSGEETEEHAAWETEFADEIAAWDAAHPSGPTWQEANTTHAAWQTTADTYTQWESNRDAWVAEDPENRDPSDYATEMEDPEPPEPGTEPPTTGIDEEPTENYPACWFKVTRAHTIYAGYYGYNSGGTPAAPEEDEEAFTAWVEAGASGSPPCPGTWETRTYGAWSTVPGMLDPGFIGGAGYSETTGYPNPPAPTDYAAWVAEVRALIDAQATFPKPGCTGTECESSYSVTPAPPEAPPESDAFDDLLMDAVAARYRHQIPATWPDPYTSEPAVFPGTYFRIVWNVIEEPDGWDDTIDDPEYEPPEEEPEGGWPPVPQIPKPGRPLRSFIPFPDAEEGADENDWIWEWTGPGIAEDPASWLSEAYDLGIPTVPGRRYVANIRFVCREDWFIGDPSQVTGTAVEIPEP